MWFPFDLRSPFLGVDIPSLRKGVYGDSQPLGLEVVISVKDPKLSVSSWSDIISGRGKMESLEESPIIDWPGQVTTRDGFPPKMVGIFRIKHTAFPSQTCRNKTMWTWMFLWGWNSPFSIITVITPIKMTNKNVRLGALWWFTWEGIQKFVSF